MALEIECLYCGRPYKCNNYTTKIVGPIIETTCPICKMEIKKNMSAFLDVIIGGDECVFVPKAMAMIRLSREIGRLVNNETSYSKRCKLI